MKQYSAEFLGPTALRPMAAVCIRLAASLQAALVSEVVMTMFFLLVILGATDRRAPAGFAPIVGGLLGAGAYRFIAGAKQA